jgi:hypothetical protein
MRSTDGAWGLSALACTYLGDLVAAKRRIERYRYLMPNASSAFLFEAGSAVVEIGRKDYAAAIDTGRRTTELNPGFIPDLRIYLVALGHGGMMAEAAFVRQRVLLLQPDLTVRAAMAASPYQGTEQREHYGEEASTRRGGGAALGMWSGIVVCRCCRGLRTWQATRSPLWNSSMVWSVIRASITSRTRRYGTE